MKNFVLHTILSSGDKDFQEGIYIILFNVTSTPPHLLLAVDGKIYSITDSGRQVGSPLEKLLLFIKRKNIPSIFVEWKTSNVESVEKITKEQFSRYERVVEGKISCLFPIRDVVANVLGEEFKKAGFIFELLPLMEKAGALGNTFELNMQSAMTNGSFELITYTQEQLSDVLRMEHGLNGSGG
ncbi:hypothetical protein BH11BAC7_BH11BAC7_26740 [soil metagenome]